MRVHRAVLEAGARVSGATVHFVDAEYDRGPIVAQWPVPVAAGDTPESLAARVLRVEHLLLPRAVDALARGAVRLGADGRVEGGAAAAPLDPFALARPESFTLATDIDALFPA
jgi:folate-dependent phosphoribosylglycinamide formyltransferase PurN